MGPLVSIRMLAAVLAVLLLAGCAGSSGTVGSLMVAPGKYAFYKCPDLITAARGNEAQLKSLEGLMAKAKTGPAGGLVSATTYEPQYVQAQGELDEIRREARAKNCDLSKPATPAAPPPAKPAAAKKPAKKSPKKPKQ